VATSSPGSFILGCDISKNAFKALAIFNQVTAKYNRIYDNTTNVYLENLISASDGTIIENNLIFNGTRWPTEEGGIVFHMFTGSVSFAYNTLLLNQGNIHFTWMAAPYRELLIYSNNLLDPVNGYSILNESAAPFDAKNNWWGTVESSEIDELIWDYIDDFDYGLVTYEPYASTPIASAPGFVMMVYIDPEPVLGAGLSTFTIEFSSNMDTTIAPIVTAGVQEPYTQITIPGEYIDPQHWQGSLDVTLFTGDGIYHLRIQDAVDSLGMEVIKDTRFTFEIDTAGISGVDLQASGESGRIDLYYNPVDEPDLAGYNIYRGDVSGGPYTKINPAVVVDSFYSDYTAPEGITKHYVVTAVRTDFTESDPSDEASAAAVDGTGPVFMHVPVPDSDDALPGITIQCSASDVSGIGNVTLYYKKTDESVYQSEPMENPSGDLYSLNIPGSYNTLEGVDYFIVAEDTLGNRSGSGSEEAPNHIIVYTKKGTATVPAGTSSHIFADTDVAMDISDSDTEGEVVVYRLDTSTPNAPADCIAKYWIILGLEESSFSADLDFHYLDSDITGMFEPGLIVLRSDDGGDSYTSQSTVITEEVNLAEVNDVTDFSFWTIQSTFTSCWDDDGDGYDDEVCGGDDCDDSSPDINPGAEELCDNGFDDDCDSLVDYYDPDCFVFTLELEALYLSGYLSLTYTLSAIEPATWANYLVLTAPSVQVIPLWTVPLPVIYPPVEIPVAFPMPSIGLVGIWTGLYTAGGPQGIKLAWVDTGQLNQ